MAADENKKKTPFLRGFDLRSSAQISGNKSARFRVFPQPANYPKRSAIMRGLSTALASRQTSQENEAE
jgi:hypothetical protein